MNNNNNKKSFFMHPLENPEINNFSIEDRKFKSLKKLETSIHFHEYYEIEFVYEGEATHLLNGLEYKISSGYIALLTPHDFHSWHLSDTQELKIYNITFTDINVTDEIRRKLLSLNYTLHGNLSNETFHILINLFNTIKAYFLSPTNNFGDIQKSLLDSIINIMIDDLPAVANNSNNTKTINELLLYIERKYTDETLSLAQISYDLNKSPDYLGRCIKKYTQMNFNQYLMEKRLNYAENLLRVTTETISTIAALSGFSSSSYFIKAFKQKYNKSPRQYLKDIKE